MFLIAIDVRVLAGLLHGFCLSQGVPSLKEVELRFLEFSPAAVCSDLDNDSHLVDRATAGLFVGAGHGLGVAGEIDGAAT